jgi:hypothetical protein
MSTVPIRPSASVRLKAVLFATGSISMASAGLWLSLQHSLDPGLVATVFSPVC